MASIAAQKKLFGESALYFQLFAEIVPRVLAHRYRFVSDEWFSQNLGDCSTEEINRLCAQDLLEKSHFAAATTLIRMERWASAACVMHDARNFPGFAGALRGLIESSGDSVHGLLNISFWIAENKVALRDAYKGRAGEALLVYTEAENVLDHYIHARWTGRERDAVKTAKPNVDYVRLIGPDAEPLYHRLCGVVHPSNSSVDWMLDLNSVDETGIALVANDAARIDRLLNEFRSVLERAMQMGCNSALLTLRVLHKFPLHPRIPELKKVQWTNPPAAAKIERLLAQ